MLRSLRPLPRALQGVACAWCDRLQASWQHREQDMVCALCVLYHKDVWSKEIEQAITNVETANNRMFDRTPAGMLVHCKDADGVLGVVVLTARVMGINTRAAKIRGSE